MSTLEIGRMSPKNDLTNPVHGVVAWIPVKSLWFTTHAAVAVIGGWLIRTAGEHKRPRTTVFFDEP